MPRPRRDSEILPAKERLENAFWELLEDREYHKITVTDIVREANVNRNSFYYHFSGLSELADAAILHTVEQMPLSQLSMDRPELVEDEWREHVDGMVGTRAQHDRLTRLSLLAGPHSSPELMAALKDFTRMSIIAMLGIDDRNMSMETQLMLDFTVGGMLAVLERWPELEDRVMSERLVNDNFAMLAFGMYMQMSREDMLERWNRIFREGHKI